LSYDQLDHLSDEVAAFLANRYRIAPGDLVALVLPSTPDYVVAYAAIAKLGAITAGVNPRFTADEQAAVLEVARPRLVITTLEGAPSSVEQCCIVPATGAESLLAEQRANFAGRRDRHIEDECDPDRLVAVVFTSGTTGTPKGAMFGNREMAAITSCDLGERADTWGGGAAMLASTQFAHVGFMTKLPWYLRTGSTTYLLDRWRSEDVLRLVHEHRMASIGGIAPQVALMLRNPQFDDYDFSCVKTIIMGGALSPPALVQEARRRFGAAYSIRYSSTESGGVGTATAFDADDDEALHSIGRPRAGVGVKVLDEHGHECGPGEVGELCLRSHCMMRGYWRDPHGTSEVLREGWLHSGDLASIDESGLIRLAGRQKEMFIRGGYNVYPVEVESVLASHPAVAEVAVVPRHDDVMGEIGVAVLVPVPGARAPTLEELRAFARVRLADYKLPEAIVLTPSLPRTALDKIDRRAIAAVMASPSDPRTGEGF